MSSLKNTNVKNDAKNDVKVVEKSEFDPKLIKNPNKTGFKFADYGSQGDMGIIEDTWNPGPGSAYTKFMFQQYYNFIASEQIPHVGKDILLIENKTIDEVIKEIITVFGMSSFKKGDILVLMNEPGKCISEVKVFLLGSNIIQIQLTSYYKDVDHNMMIIEEMYKNDLVKGYFSDITWCFSKKGEVDTFTIRELIGDKFYKEAYPFISGDIEQFSHDYLVSNESVLLLQGVPGCGKTRFIRYIIREHAKKFNTRPEVMYISSNKTLDMEELYVQFATGDYHFLVIEDIDQVLKSRKGGNDVMSSLLTSSDGLINSPNKKIILTTNLPNIRDIDDALLRPGRCFDSVNFRKLTISEAEKLHNMIHTGIPFNPDRFEDQENVSLAEVYNIK